MKQTTNQQADQVVKCSWLSSVSQSDECVERLQICHFCDLELPWRELEEHTLTCGSRTELCRECGRYITLRDQREHALTCSSTDQVSSHPRTTSKLGTNAKRMQTWRFWGQVVIRQEWIDMLCIYITLLVLFFVFTVRASVSCATCKKSFSAEDIEKHKVHICIYIIRHITEHTKKVFFYQRGVKINSDVTLGVSN